LRFAPRSHKSRVKLSYGFAAGNWTLGTSREVGDAEK
jgi:hypothetical protein